MSNVVTTAHAARRSRPTIIALHCSGSSRRQWRQLASELGDQFVVISLDLFGTDSIGPWFGEQPFRLTHEAAIVLNIIDDSETPVHLVGHSYGGAVALRAAIERSNRIATLSLYEPSAFHILRSMGPEGRDVFHGVRAVATQIERATLSGTFHIAAKHFVDYWNGSGAWAAMSPDRQAQILRYLPKANLDFQALFNEPTPLVAYRRLKAPLLLMQGEYAPDSTSTIINKLTSFMQPASVITVAGAGHMGPISHAEFVAREMSNFIRSNTPHVAHLYEQKNFVRYAA